MQHQWSPEKTIEPPQALRLIQEQFPELQAKHIRLLGNGWDNTAFVIDEERIFRFPRRAIALPLLEAEWNLLPRLAPRLPVAIPVPQWKGVPTPSFAWPFIGYPMLPGFTACHANLSEGERSALAEPLAHFLSVLHATPQVVIAECDISGDNLSRVDKTHMIPKITRNLDEIELLGLLEHKRELKEIVDASHHLRFPRVAAIVHGDFYVRHLLVDDKHRLAGVIDWGDVHFGDPAIDLAIAHSFLPPEAHERFKKTYGPIEEETWRLARLRALVSSTFIILFGHHSGDPDIVREGLRSLKSIARNR